MDKDVDVLSEEMACWSKCGHAGRSGIGSCWMKEARTE